ncbi:hypothetical protein DRO54_00680 [Candidatus Bathyarchaeota archaeon]|nr:MAG: hypothetical protein DRO54_00680 [Candidatus Bathyarchaeota archaeon]
MYLTREEERILDGEYGWACQVCMRILVKLGELYGATRLIPISSAHISGISYKTIGDAAVNFLNAIIEKGAKTRVFSTLNPSSIDPCLVDRLSKGLVEKQREILKLYEMMGAKLSLSCTPYYEYAPPKNSNLAWAESSAVVYANSILGAWTNREGAPSALASAIIGKTPNYGVHQSENRKPSILIDVQFQPKDEVEYGALGYYVGRIAEDKIPFLRGLKNPSLDELKQLGAALASSGMVSMFHYGKEQRLTDKLEVVTVEGEEIKAVMDELSPSKFTPDMIFIGCPHCSLKEIEMLANLVQGKKLKDNIEFWVCVSRYVKNKGEKFIEIIKDSGAKVLTDTCAVVTWTDKLGIKKIMTNSVKAAHYLPTMNKAEVILASMRECVKIAYE